ncbi:Gag protein [Phytophthora palmivora]|uniref:Gag protein n=1 Tax=Phytophthora palmivora TaxID=4796 RepID=A0A2P4Y0Q3_9STRA|nr:Gag protein [Phytophthora palmivora]
MDRGVFPNLTDSQFESVRKMVDIFGGYALRSLAAATPAEQAERIEVFDTYERGLIATYMGCRPPDVREVELAMDAALISTERLRVAFALSNLEGRAKTWAATFLPANYEYRQHSRFLVCKRGKHELHEYIQEMRLFRVHANTMEEAIQIALQEEYSHRQARTPTSVWQGHNASSGAVCQVSARLADGTMVNVPGVRMDLAVKFENFDSTALFLVLDMDKYDLILGMPWLEKHEPWIDWRGKAIGASRPAVSDRAMVNNVPTLATGRETTASSNAESRRAVWASTVAVLDGTDQAGNIGPQAAEVAEESAEGVSCVGNIGVRNLVSHEVEETEKMNESAVCVLSVGSRVSRGVKKTSTRAEVLLNTSRVDNKVPRSESETPPARPVEEQCHVFDGVSGRQVRTGAIHLEALSEVSALLNLEEVSMKDFLVELKAGEIAEMVLLKPETSPEDLNTSSVMDEDFRKGFTKHALDLVEGYYQILMRESGIPLTAVSTPSGMLWEWLTYFDAIFVHRRAEDGQTAMEVHLKHLRRLFQIMRGNNLDANINKCVFAAEEITVLGYFGSRVGVRANPGKVKAVAAWPTPRSQKDLRK